MNVKAFIFLLCGVCLISSCKKQTSQNFPNEMSEMALAMRDMTDKLEKVKSDLNEPSISRLNFRSFDSFKMTDKSFDKPGFSDMAQRLIVLSEKFDSNPTTQNYNEIIYMCQSCHNYLCPGPLELIKKLEYSVDDLDQ